MNTMRSTSDVLFRVMLVAGLVLVLANLAVAGVNMVRTSKVAPDPSSKPYGNTLLAEAEATTPAPSAQGAPIDAPAQGASPDAAASDSPDPKLGPPSRVIPQASIDMVNQYEKAVGGEEGEADKWDFKPTKDGKWLKLTFTGLGGFTYENPDPDMLAKKADPYEGLKDQVPEPIKKLDDKPVVLVGFMVPVEIDRRGQVKSFALTQDQMFCCYGVAPEMNQWVMVTMDEGQTAKYSNDLPIAVFGALDIGEEIEEGYVLSLFRMKASEVITVRELLERSKEDS